MTSTIPGRPVRNAPAPPESAPPPKRRITLPGADGMRHAFSRASDPRVRAFVLPVVLVLMLVGVLVSLRVIGTGVELRDIEQHHSDLQTGRAGGSLIAQSFSGKRDNLSAIELTMAAAPDLKAKVTMRLLEGNGTGGKEIWSAPLGAADFRNNPYLVVHFPAIANSAGVTYTLVIRGDAPLEGAFNVRYNSVDVLSSGELYLNGEAQEGDLTFSTYYHYDVGLLFADIIGTLSQNALPFVSWVLLLMLPGSALLFLLPSVMTVGQRLLLAPCLTALVLPIFLLVTRALGIHLNTPLAWLILAACGLPLLYRLRKGRSKLRFGGLSGADLGFWSLFAGVLFATVIARLVPLRDAVGGMGLDAYHHTLIGEMFVRSGGIPADYEPYAPLASFTYHYGFHALIAAIAWLSGHTSASDIMTLMPQTGQIATTLPVLSLTVFGWRVLGNRWVGLSAGTLVGLVSIFPAYYVNWSRYTQGLGLALLPVAWLLLIEALEWRTGPVNLSAKHAAWSDVTSRSGPLMLAVIGAAGLALTHYRIAMIYAAFLALYLLWLVSVSLSRRAPARETLRPILRTGLIGALTLATLSPWLLNLARNFGTRFVGKTGSATVSEGYYSLQTMGIEPLLNTSSILLLAVLALGGVVWAVKQRNPMPVLPALTWLILGLWSNPYLLPVRLPYAGYLDSTTLATGIWLPLSLMAGYTLAASGNGLIRLAATQAGLPQSLRPIFVGATAIIIGLAALLGGAAASLSIVPMIDRKPYIQAADAEALLWMRSHLPPTTSVLANPFAFPWDPSPQAIQGSDAGLWVPLLTEGMKSSVPPVPAYNERLADPDYIKNIRDIVGSEPFGEVTPNWDDLKARGITHIFVGSRGGALNLPQIMGSDHANVVFHKDAVWIFELR